jgi:phosphoglycerate dehydrogenase-like enzyme
MKVAVTDFTFPSLDIESAILRPLGAEIASGQCRTSEEPIPEESPLRMLDNVVVSSHVASASEPAVRKLRETAAGIVADVLRGMAPRNVVNGVGDS